MESDVVLGTALVSMYGKCGSVENARKAFKKVRRRNVVSWTAMIAACARYGCCQEACELFHQMRQEGVKPNKITFVSILNSCRSPEASPIGKHVHSHFINRGIRPDVDEGNALFCMYAKCGSIEGAQAVFGNILQRNVVSWTEMIAAYAFHGHCKEALKHLHQLQLEGMKLKMFNFTCILSACLSTEALALGKQVHSLIVETAAESDSILTTALVSMYGKCGSIEDAQKVFSKMHERDVVSWNAMIAACTQHGLGEEALELFLQMQHEGVKPDKVTFISILNACSILAVLGLGKQVHAQLIASRIESDVVVETTLVNMYGKCGSIEDAWMVFNKMYQRNVVSWTAMISACAQHRYGKEALQLFQQMLREGINPDDVSVISLLSACSHANLVNEGLGFFNSMTQEYGIIPTVEHCNCIVHLLGRAGQVNEVEDFIDKMPCKPTAVTWMTLLGSCGIYGSIEGAKRAAECALQLDPKCVLQHM